MVAFDGFALGLQPTALTDLWSNEDLGQESYQLYAPFSAWAATVEVEPDAVQPGLSADFSPAGSLDDFAGPGHQGWMSDNRLDLAVTLDGQPVTAPLADDFVYAPPGVDDSHEEIAAGELDIWFGSVGGGEAGETQWDEVPLGTPDESGHTGPAGPWDGYWQIEGGPRADVDMFLF